MKDAVEIMNDMIQLDLDAIVAYGEAIEACEIQDIRMTLRSFQGDHERHVRDLSERVLAHGGSPKQKRDAKGFVIQAFTKVTSRGDRSALTAMRGNEELTNRSYASALGHDELPADVRAILSQNLDDERRHLAWIRDAIDRRAWDPRPGAHV